MREATQGAYTGDIGSDIASGSITPHDAGLQALGELSRALVRLLRDKGGRGPTSARTSWLGEDALLVTFGDCFTQAEKTLWAAGAAEAAERYRRTLHDVLANEMRAMIEHASGRPVRGQLFAAHHEPDVMVEIFMLGPAPGP